MNDVDLDVVAVRAAKSAVAGDDRRIQRLGQGYVHGIARCERGSQCPGAADQVLVRVTDKRKLGEIVKRLVRTTVAHYLTEAEAADNVQHLHVEKLRRVQRGMIGR